MKRLREALCILAALAGLAATALAATEEMAKADSAQLWKLASMAYALAYALSPTFLEARRSALVALALVFIGGCEPKRWHRIERYCRVDAARAAPWIVQCAEAANPKSDEEGEDLVAQCERTAERLFCIPEWTYWSQDGKLLCRRGDQRVRHLCRNEGWDGQ